MKQKSFPIFVSVLFRLFERLYAMHMPLPRPPKNSGWIGKVSFKIREAVVAFACGIARFPGDGCTCCRHRRNQEGLWGQYPQWAIPPQELKSKIARAPKTESNRETGTKTTFAATRRVFCASLHSSQERVTALCLRPRISDLRAPSMPPPPREIPVTATGCWITFTGRYG